MELVEKNLNKIHFPYDKLFKESALYFSQHFLEYFNLDDVLISSEPTEIITQDNKTLRMDYVFKTKDNKLVDLEFHTGNIKEKNLVKFNSYITTIHSKTNMRTDLYVIASGKRDSSVLSYVPSNSHEFKAETIFIRELDGEKKLKNVKRKIKNNIKLTKKEQLDLIFIPLMEDKEKQEQLAEEVCKLTNQLSYLTEEEKYKIKKAQMLMLVICIEDKNTYKRLKNVITMNINFLIEDEIELREEGRLEGMKEGVDKLVKSLEKEGVSKKLIDNALKNI